METDIPEGIANPLGDEKPSETAEKPAIGPVLARNSPMGKGPPKGNRNRLKHGLRAARKPLDRRKAVDRRVLATMAALEGALGTRMSPQRALIIANIGRQLSDLAKAEAYESELESARGSLFNRTKHAPLPITEAKWRLLDSINRNLERIGLDVSGSAEESLEDIVASFSSRNRSSVAPARAGTAVARSASSRTGHAPDARSSAGNAPVARN